ncbi:MAG: histone deacetylase family protein [Anaerolineae bacterium]|nr:histone deacetylase family protein [Anaerolineae bacterium]
MTKTPLHTFYSPHHALHNPRGEFLHGRIVPYYEMPQRIEAIHHAITASPLFDLKYQESIIAPHLLHTIHDPDMITYLMTLGEQSQARIRADYTVYGLADQLTDDEYYYESIFHPPAHGKSGLHNPPKAYLSDSTCPIGKNTWRAILASASLAYDATQAVLNGEKRAYAVCRPPGHHAGRDFVGGYCYLNNAALAAENLRSRGKVAILDVDYHHGNGTQDIFYDNPDVLFISIHSDPIIDYPHTTGYADEIGVGAGVGTTINYPMPHGTDDETYLETLNRAIHAIHAFGAEALVVSLGFDTYINDPMGAFKLTKGVYTRMGRMIDNMNLPTVYIQEGGYAVDELGALAVAFFEGVVADG